MRYLLAAVLILAAVRDLAGPGALVLAVLGLAAVWAVVCWLSPYGPCRRCDGRGPCKRCGGTRRVRRPGAAAVHRVVLVIRTHISNRKKEDRV